MADGFGMFDPDEYFMKQALRLAQEAFDQNEVCRVIL
jgi:glycogen synthase